MTKWWEPEIKQNILNLSSKEMLHLGGSVTMMDKGSFFFLNILWFCDVTWESKQGRRGYDWDVKDKANTRDEEVLMGKKDELYKEDTKKERRS